MNTIFIDQEYGFQYWVWRTDQDPVEAFKNHSPETCLEDPTVLPGTIKKIEKFPKDIPLDFYCHWHQRGDSSIQPTDKPWETTHG